MISFTQFALSMNRTVPSASRSKSNVRLTNVRTVFSFVERRRYSAISDTPGATSCCRVTEIRSSNFRCRSGWGLRAEPPPTPVANEASAVVPISQSCTMLSPSVP